MGIIQRQGLKNLLLSYSGIALGFLSLLVIQPKLLSTEVIGLTRVLFSFSFLISTLNTLGIGNITTRFFPFFKNNAERHSGFLGLVLLFPLIGTAITALILVVFKPYIASLYAAKSPLFNEYYYWSIPFSYLIATAASVSVYCNALFKSTVPSLLNDVVIRLLFIFLVVLFWAGFLDLTTFVAFYVLTYLVQLFFLLVYLNRVDTPSIRVSAKLVKRDQLSSMLSYGFLLLFAGTASMGIKLLDTIILGQYVRLDLVGVYAVVAFIPTFIEAPLNALDRIATPKIADALSKSNIQEVRNIYTLSSRYLFAIGSWLVLLVVFNINDLLSFLPEQYMLGHQVVVILSFSALINLITGSNNGILYSSDKFYFGSLAIILISIGTLGLLYVLIPVYGLNGAALAIAISSMVYNVFKYFFIWFRYRIQPFDMFTLKLFTILLLCGSILYFIDIDSNPFLNIVLKGLLTTAVYGLAVYYIGLFNNLNLKKLF